MALRWDLDKWHPATTMSNDTEDLLQTLYKILDDQEAPRTTALHQSQKIKWNVEMLTFLLNSGSDVRMEPRHLQSPLEFVFNIKDLEPKRNDGVDLDVIRVLYAAGARLDQTIAGIYRDLIPQFILDDQEPLLPLTGLCRRRIRLYLLNPAGGNHANLFTAVQRLPLPPAIRDFLLFNVFNLKFSLEPEEIMDESFIQQYHYNEHFDTWNPWD